MADSIAVHKCAALSWTHRTLAEMKSPLVKTESFGKPGVEMGEQKENDVIS